jgi:hypothetical protein
MAKSDECAPNPRDVPLPDAAVALILGILFVASGFLHATDTRGTAMVASPANMAALRRVNASRAARVVEAPTLL